MPGEYHNGMQCTEFEALFSDAMDDVLSGKRLESFQAHARSCQLCGPLWAEAQEGRHWLKSLAEVEPPANLVNNILIATTGLETTRLHAQAQVSEPSMADRFRDMLDRFVSPFWAFARQPRFVMSFGMAFFSLSVALSVAGVKVNDLAHVDLRPSAIRRNYYETSGRVVKYYENIRFVYEIESRVREFKRATTPAEPGPQEENNKQRKNDNTSGQPDQNKERNYSQGENQPVLAATPDDPPVVMGTTHRRFV